MKIEEIPADKLFGMTAFWHRAFNAAGCNPMCHCCEKMIPVGTNFKLATIREVTIDIKNSANTSTTAYEQSKLQAILGEDVDRPDNIIDNTHEVMLCEICTPELFQDRQLKESKKGAKYAKEYYENGGGCLRINGKIIH